MSGHAQELSELDGPSSQQQQEGVEYMKLGKSFPSASRLSACMGHMIVIWGAMLILVLATSVLAVLYVKQEQKMNDAFQELKFLHQFTIKEINGVRDNTTKMVLRINETINDRYVDLAETIDQTQQLLRREMSNQEARLTDKINNATCSWRVPPDGAVFSFDLDALLKQNAQTKRTAYSDYQNKTLGTAAMTARIYTDGVEVDIQYGCDSQRWRREWPFDGTIGVAILRPDHSVAVQWTWSSLTIGSCAHKESVHLDRWSYRLDSLRSLAAINNGQISYLIELLP